MPKTASVAEEILAKDAKKGRGRRYVPKHTKAASEPDSLDGQAPTQATEQPKKKGPVPSRQRKALQSYSADGDLVDIWERRILNPDHRESNPIRIKTPGMRLRWINLSNRGRFQRARYEQGWVPVHRGELLDEREISGVTFTSEGYVCRGEKQGEMLMKMPHAVYNKIQERRSDLNAQSYKKLKEQMGKAGGAEIAKRHGSIAGEQAEEAANNFIGSVKFGIEKERSDDLFD